MRNQDRSDGINEEHNAKVEALLPQMRTQDIPEGYTAREWAGMVVASQALDLRASPICPPIKRVIYKKIEGGKCQLYRHYNKDNELLYVGISLNSVARLMTHKTCASWFDEIETVKIEKFASRQEAVDHERLAILNEKPKYNIFHNPDAVREGQFIIYFSPPPPERMDEMNCGKRRYKNENDAVGMAARMVGRKDTSYLRHYECPHCGGWHITKGRKK